ncbi:PQQ-binding-like beta-propeller repeat protein [Streptomyces sp. NPDC088752]|uniref:outer membrane protein assembly factor BamB family protein n=1 Tax=Streptomyces sp. NPDC088752 TaxID=3154963 RepID=UPI0034322A6A
MEHVEFAHGGDAVVVTRTTRKPRLNGSSDIADRFVEIHSTRTGTLLERFRSTDFAQDGALVYGRSGTTVFAHAISDGRREWSTDTGEELGDPRKKGADPVHLTGERILVQARDARTTIALDRRSGRQLWRAVLPGRMEAVHPLDGERMLVQYCGGFAFAGPEGIEHNVAVPPPGNSARQRLEHLTMINGLATAVVVDSHDVSAPVLTVFSEQGELAHQPLRIPLPAAHVQAVLTRSAVYVLPWVPDGQWATLRAYDLAGGVPLWSVDVPDRLTITDSTGPAPSLHPFRGGLYGVDYASGWILPSS